MMSIVKIWRTKAAFFLAEENDSWTTIHLKLAPSPAQKLFEQPAQRSACNTYTLILPSPSPSPCLSAVYKSESGMESWMSQCTGPETIVKVTTGETFDKQLNP